MGIFPNSDSLLRRSACVLIEAHDEWQDSDRRYLSEASLALLNPAATHRHRDQHIPAGQDHKEDDRRYGIVALTRRAMRDELHHSLGRDQQLPEQPASR